MSVSLIYNIQFFLYKKNCHYDNTCVIFIQSTSDIYNIKKTTGLFLHLFLSFTLQLQFKSITYSLINSFPMKQFISSLEMVQSSPTTTYPFFLPSLLQLYQGKQYHFNHHSTAFFSSRKKVPSAIVFVYFFLPPLSFSCREMVPPSATLQQARLFESFTNIPCKNKVKQSGNHL